MKLLAPNGKTTNLTPEQYRLVRTPAFKKWFGDWENYPENASKVVDANGEPLVVSHTTNNDYTIFNDRFSFFSKDIIPFGEKIISSFLSIKNPYILNDSGSWSNINISKRDKRWQEIFNDLTNEDGIVIEDVCVWAKDKGYDGVIAYNIGETEDGSIITDDFISFNSIQIKLADGSNTTFDGSNPDIRFVKGGNVKETIKLSDKNFFTNYQNIMRGWNFDEKSYSTGKPLRVYRDKIGRIILLDGHHRISDKMTECVQKVFGKNDDIKYIEQKKYIKQWLPCVLKLEFEVRFIDDKELFKGGWKEDLENNFEDWGSFRSLTWLVGDDMKFYLGGTTIRKPKTKLLSPNGKPSNLNPEQYKLVRTPAFKKWFGDWENDPNNSSKVVDENGEPLIVWHGSDKRFNYFNEDYQGLKVDRWKNIVGFYFSENENSAYTYTYSDEHEKYMGWKYVRPYFLNIRNLKTHDLKDEFGEPSYWDNEYDEYILSDKRNGFDGVMLKNIIDILQGAIKGKSDFDYWSHTYAVFEPTQIKLADGTNTTFDGRHPDIRFDNGGQTPYVKPAPKYEDGEVLDLKGYGKVKILGSAWLMPPLTARPQYIYDFLLNPDAKITKFKKNDFSLYEYEVDMMLVDVDTGIDYEKSYEKYLGSGLRATGNPPLQYVNFIKIINSSLYYKNHPEFELNPPVSNFYNAYAITKFDLGGTVPNLLYIEEIENKLGRKINSWNDDVVVIGGQKYKKVYLRPEYKKVYE